MQKMINIGKRCDYHANKLELSIQKAWDDTVEEIDNKLTVLIANEAFNYNMISRIQFALQIKDSKIEQKLRGLSEKFERVISSSINDFAQKIKKLAFEEKQKWILEEEFDANNLSGQDLRIYKLLATALPPKMQAEPIADDSSREMSFLELIGSYVFDVECSIDFKEIEARFNPMWDNRIMWALFSHPYYVVEPNGIQIFLERIQKGPEKGLLTLKDEKIERLNTVCRRYIIQQCEVYTKQSRAVQNWISSTIMEQTKK